MTMLQVQGLGKRFGGLTALADVGFEVAEGSIVGVMGANGAGKTTLFSLIAGNARPTAGDIRFEGRSIVGLSPDRICRLGIARTFQIVKPFPAMTVLENLRTAGLFGRAAHRDAAAADRASMAVLEEVGLAAQALQPASTLTLSAQKRLEVARAVATGARLLLLDEISEGLAPVIVEKLAEVVTALRAEGYTVLMVEQNFHFAAPLADRFVVMDHGEVVDAFDRAALPSRRDRLQQQLGV